MWNKKTIIAVVIAVLVLGFFYFNQYIYDEKQAEYVVGEMMGLSGRILATDFSQILFDGPYVFTLESEGGTTYNINIPSMGLPMCEAYKAKNIGDVSLIKVGDLFEVKGEVGEDGSIVPCASTEHYFRPQGIVVDDFEGEADPSRMTLGMKTWVWQNALYNDGRNIKPVNPARFTLSFKDDGTFSASTDCNGIGGNYSTKGDNIEFSRMISTLMYCEGSQENDFRELLTNSSEYHFTSRGELILDLKFDSGTATFR